MSLTSSNFLLFLICCVILYYVIPKKGQWILLLIASYVFYFINGVFYPLFLFSTTVLTYTTALAIDRKAETSKAWLKEHKEELSRAEKKEFKASVEKTKKRYMLVGLLACLLILGIFKYSNFVIENVNAVLGLVGSKHSFDAWDLLMPMGLSFYTFQSIGYLLDVYLERGPVQKNFFKYMLFVSFFPQLIQGPISRYTDVADSMFAEHSFEWKQIKFGSERILWGFFKKLVIADMIAPAVICISEDPDLYAGAWVLVGIVFYAVQLYADFSGGIDITIGVAQLFGIKLPENFIRPFFTKSIAEFWRCWHITMGTWFRDYIFYPMSISEGMMNFTTWCKNKFGKGVAKRVPVYWATMVTWFATGIWHGASWNFIIWGVLNGVVILASEELEPFYRWFHAKFPRLVSTKGYGLFQIIRTFLLMGCLRMLDCYRDAAATFRMFISMFTDFHITSLTGSGFLELGVTTIQYVIVAVGCVIMLLVSLAGIKGSVREQLEKKPFIVRYVLMTGMLVAVVMLGAYGYGFDSAQFIYNQF